MCKSKRYSIFLPALPAGWTAASVIYSGEGACAALSQGEGLTGDGSQGGCLALRVEGQGVGGGRMSATVEFHGQFRARLAEISQRKAERDHGVELW